MSRVSKGEIPLTLFFKALARVIMLEHRNTMLNRLRAIAASGASNAKNGQTGLWVSAHQLLRKSWPLWAIAPATSEFLPIRNLLESSPYLSFRSHGQFFVNTNKDPPYAKGILPEFTFSDNATETETPPPEL